MTNSDLGVAVDRLESKIEAVDTKIDAVAARLEGKIEPVETRLGSRIDGLSSRIDGVEVQMRMLQWMVGLNFAATLGVLWKLLR